jgi:hypothetical protein
MTFNPYNLWNEWSITVAQPSTVCAQHVVTSLKTPTQLLQLDCNLFSNLSYDRSKASSKANSPNSAIQSFLFQMRVSSPFLKVIQ